jgi:hypothetical protein
MVGIDPVSGALRYERIVSDEHAGAMDPPVDADKRDRRNSQNWMDYKTDLAPDRSNAFSMRGARPDILVGSDDSVYMRQMRFTTELEEMDKSLPHIFSTSGLLDGWEHNRTYTVFGTGDFSTIPVAYSWIIKKQIKVPVGLMLTFDNQTLWAVTRGKTGCAVTAGARPSAQDKESSRPDFEAEKRKGFQKSWSQSLKMRPRSMIQAGDHLILGGTPPDRKGNLYELAARGDLPGTLQVLSAKDGELLQNMNIESPPTWDGMAVNDGRLIIPCVDGSIACWSAE